MKTIHTLLLVLLALSLTANNEQWTNYSSFEQVTDLVEIDDKVYIASMGGLAVWDQTTDEKSYYNRGNSDIAANNIVDLQVDAEGKLWLSSARGLQRFEEGVFSALLELPRLSMSAGRNEDEKLIGASVDSLYIVKQDDEIIRLAIPWYAAEIPELYTDTEQNRVYVGLTNWFAPSALLALEGQQWLEAEDSILQLTGYYQGHKMLLDTEDRFWCLTTEESHQLQDGEWTSQNYEEMLQQEYFIPHAITEDQNGNLVVSGKDFFEYRVLWQDGDGWNDLELPQSLREDGVQTLLVTEDNDLLLGSSIQGLFEWKNDEAVKVSLDQSVIRTNRILTLLPYDAGMFIQDGGHYWYHKDGVWEDLSTLPGVPTGNVARSIAASDAAGLWIAEGQMIYQYTGEAWLGFFTILIDDAELMAAGEDGSLWLQAGTYLYRYLDGEWTSFGFEDHGFASASFQDLHVTDDGQLWASHLSGVCHYDGSDWTNSQENFLSITAFQLATDEQGDLWFTSNETLHKLANGNLSTFDLSGLPGFNPWTSQLYFDEANQLWITGHSSLYRWSEAGVISYDMANSCIAEGQYRQIARDEHGNFWLGSISAGVMVFHPEGLAGGLSIEGTKQLPSSSLLLYPKPINPGEILYVDSPLLQDQSAVISIRDFSGRPILSLMASALVQSYCTEVIVPDLKPGLYVLTVRTQSQVVSDVFVVL